MRSTSCGWRLVGWLSTRRATRVARELGWVGLSRCFVGRSEINERPHRSTSHISTRMLRNTPDKGTTYMGLYGQGQGEEIAMVARGSHGLARPEGSGKPGSKFWMLGGGGGSNQSLLISVSGSPPGAYKRIDLHPKRGSPSHRGQRNVDKDYPGRSHACISCLQVEPFQLPDWRIVVPSNN